MSNFDTSRRENSLGIDPEQLAAAEKSLENFAAAEPLFFNIPDNVKALQGWLRSRVPIGKWSEDAFALAFFHCKKPDSQFPLQSAPPKETPEQRIERLHARDRAGYTGAKHSSRAEKSTEGRTISEFEAQCAAKKAKATADADTSQIPSVESLVAGEAPMFQLLSTTDAMRLSLIQGKLYARRSSEAQVEIQRLRSEQKLARMKELGKS